MGPKRSESMRATNSVGRPIGEPDTNDSALIAGCFTLENGTAGPGLATQCPGGAALACQRRIPAGWGVSPVK